MSKNNTKKKKKPSLIKQLSLIIGIVVAVIVVAVVVIKAVNKTTIKTITVEGAYQELFIGNPDYASCEVGISVYPETANRATLMAYSENPQVATVEFDGEKLVVKAVGVGTTNIVVRHSSKSSLYDTFQVAVKDVDVQGLTFVEKDQSGTTTPINSVNIKKDGFEHIIPFDLEPIDANMNNLRIADFNDAVFESVSIDQSKKALVVVPKTEIVQTSAEIDVEIYQNTIEGYSPVQVVSLMVNLLNREAHIRFNLSSDPTRGYSKLDYEENSVNNQVVYLEQSNNANDVYVLPEIGYDKNFESIGIFNINEYDLAFDGVRLQESDYVAGVFNYKNKIMVNKAFGNYYYFKTLSNFQDGDCIFVEFIHKYTGASKGLQFIYLAVSSIGLDSDQTFELYSSRSLKIGEVSSLDFSYDTGVEKGVIEIYSFKFETIGGERVRVKTSDFGDEKTQHTVSVHKDNKKLSLWTENLSDGTTINFGIKSLYWDSRYVRINEGYYIEAEFTISTIVNGIHTEIDGKENNIARLTTEPIVVSLVSEPVGGIIDSSEVSIHITLNGTQSTAIEVSENANGNYEISRTGSVAAGTYIVRFEYKGNVTEFFVVVS